ncbi:MAG: TRAP transporter small permease subunit [Pseudomonadales bacterium]|nr:TRAP transporter small permease subunit [Pseudomonadales bacterium]
MKVLARLGSFLDGISEAMGRLSSWCAVLMVLVTCYVVFTRYVLNEGSVAIQESVTYLNAMLFLLTAAFTLKHGGHVRVDIFYTQASVRYKAWVDLLGSLLLLLPVCGFILWISWGYVQASWAVSEQSGDTGGLPYVYLLKTLIPVMALTLIVQGMAEIFRNLALLLSPSALAQTPES